MDIQAAFRRAVRRVVGLTDDEGQPPLIDHLALYRVQVGAAASDGTTIDPQPDDSRVAAHQKVQHLMGVPGVVAVVQSGAVAALGWLAGDPSKPRLLPLWEIGAKVTKLVLNASNVQLGADSGDGVLTKKDAQALYNAINTAAVVANDGGAALKANIIAALGAAGWTAAAGVTQLGSSKVSAAR